MSAKAFKAHLLSRNFQNIKSVHYGSKASSKPKDYSSTYNQSSDDQDIIETFKDKVVVNTNDQGYTTHLPRPGDSSLTGQIDTRWKIGVIEVIVHTYPKSKYVGMIPVLELPFVDAIDMTGVFHDLNDGDKLEETFNFNDYISGSVSVKVKNKTQLFGCVKTKSDALGAIDQEIYLVDFNVPDDDDKGDDGKGDDGKGDDGKGDDGKGDDGKGDDGNGDDGKGDDGKGDDGNGGNGTGTYDPPCKCRSGPRGLNNCGCKSNPPSFRCTCADLSQATSDFDSSVTIDL